MSIIVRTVTQLGPPATPLNFPQPTIPTAYIGTTYTTSSPLATLSVSGGVPTYNWSAPGLPAGLSLSAYTGAATAIIGSPTTAGTPSVTFTVQDSSGQSASRNATVTVAATPTALTLTTTALPVAAVGAAWSLQLTAAGGVPPYTYTVTGQPSWMTLNVGGVAGALGGMPTPLVMTVPVANNVPPPPAMAHGMVGANYSTPWTPIITQYRLPPTPYAPNFTHPNWTNLPTGFTASGFHGAPTFTVTSGSLPPGIAFNTSNWGGGLTGWTAAAPGTALVGIPTTAGTYNFSVAAQSPAAGITLTVTAHDSVGASSAAVPLTLPGTATSAAVAYQIVINPATTPTAPTAWPGAILSDRFLVYWWPPAEQPSMGMMGSPHHYNIYRATGNNVPFASATLVGTRDPPFGFQTYTAGTGINLFFVDGGETAALTPSTDYTYYVTAVNPQASPPEGPPSNALVVRTLAGSATAPTPPAPPLDPASWLVPMPAQLPVAGTTLWTATNTAFAATAGTAGTTNNPLNKLNVGCSLQYALNNAIPGDTIVLTSGSDYKPTYGSTGYTIPGTLNGPAMTYIIGDNVPEYNPAGHLPAFAYTPSNVDFTVVNLTAPVAALDRSATLTSAWTGRTGKWPAMFIGTDVDVTCDVYSVQFTNGSTAVNWAMPLRFASLAVMYVGVTPNCVTLSDRAYMPQFSVDRNTAAMTVTPMAQGGAAASHVRFIGLSIEPLSLAAMTPYQGNPVTYGSGLFSYNLVMIGFGATSPTNTPVSPQADHVYYDRCVVGKDSDLWVNPDGTFNPRSPNTAWAPCVRGIFSTSCKHLYIGQSYFCGFHDGVSTNASTGAVTGRGSDCQAVAIGGGGPICIQHCHLEANVECLMHGGLQIGQGQVPADLVYRYNVYSVPTQWCQTFYGGKVKNLHENKAGERMAVHGNLMLCMWNGVVAAQGGNATIFSCQDNVDGKINPFTSSCPWIFNTDIDVYDNLIWNTGKMYSAVSVGGTSATHIARLRFRNNICLHNPYMATIPGDAAVSHAWQVQVGSMFADVIFDHNHIVKNRFNKNNANANTITGYANYPNCFYSTQAGVSVPTGGGSAPAAAVAITDRIQISNNICDDPWMGGPTNTNMANYFTNFLFTNNLSVRDNTRYPRTPAEIGQSATGVAHEAVPFRGTGVSHATIGYANMQQLDPTGSSIVRPPPRGADWNVTTGTYATAASDGTSLGATRT